MADTAIIARPTQADALERVLIGGDIGKLTPEQRVEYYMRVCDSVGLNPLTQPFDYLTLQGKTILYAKKTCTDQLRALHKISVVDMSESERDGVMTVTVKVANADGRTDMDKGSVKTEGLKGDALANAIMKAATKAKRRATLSICGLGMLDESEVETIPNAVIASPRNDATAGEVPPSSPPRQQVSASYAQDDTGIMASEHGVIINEKTGREVRPNSSNQLRKNGAWDSFLDKVQGFRDARDADGLRLWFTSEAVQSKIAKWSPTFRNAADETFNSTFDWIVENQ